jgi:uncharacterized protein
MQICLLPRPLKNVNYLLFKTMTVRIFYHEKSHGVPCADGLAAAWVVRKQYPGATIVGCCYDDEERGVLPIVEPGDRIFIVDFSFTMKTLDMWAALETDVLLFDHHKTALEHLGLELPEGHNSVTSATGTSLYDDARPRFKRKYIFDMDRCGAVIAWEYFFPENAIPYFLKLIQDQDLWQKRIPGSEEILTATTRFGWSFNLFDALVKLHDDSDFNALYVIGEQLLAPKREAIAKACNQVILRSYKEFDEVPVVQLAENGSEDLYASDICKQLYKKVYPDADWVAAIRSDGTWELRSDKDKPGGGFDVSQIAKNAGGGGNRNAAGFKPVSPHTIIEASFD